MILFFLGDLKWGGSAIIFSFVLNLYSIYQSLTEHHDDNESGMTPEEVQLKNQRDFKVVFKLILFILEIVSFNYLLFLMRIIQ